MTVGKIYKTLPPVKKQTGKGMVKFCDFAKEFASFCEGVVKKLAKKTETQPADTFPEIEQITVTSQRAEWLVYRVLRLCQSPGLSTP